MNDNRCIFCKKDASTSVSEEHIIPESLGNIEHRLPPGVVCDQCNNYFAREVEAPVLLSEYFIQARSRRGVPSKRGKIPLIKGILMPAIIPVLWGPHKNGGLSIYPLYAHDSERFRDFLTLAKEFTIIQPVATDVEVSLMSRFLGKVAIEALVDRVIHVPGWRSEIVDKEELDPLRNYVRFGNPKIKWEFNQRRLYEEAKLFEDEKGAQFDVLHEWDFIYTEEQELFFVLAIFGVEYAISLSNPDISNYKDWLRSNKNKSKLLDEKT